VETYNFKSISIYFDKLNNLLGVPSTIVKKWNALVDIDKITNLIFPYTIEDVELFLKNTFCLCYAYELENLPKISAIQNYRGAKSYSTTVKNLGMVSLSWLDGQGYKVIPTWQNARQKNAFVHLESKTTYVSEHYEKCELAVNLFKAINLSPIGPIYSEPT